MKLELNNHDYEVISNDNNCLNKEELKDKCTEYFEPFDYIFGDYSYDKLKLFL